MGSSYNLKAAREYAKMSQKELAETLGVTQQSIYYYEAGDRDIKSSLLLKMANALGVTVSYLLGTTNDPHGEAPASPDLSANETELIGLYRRMEPEQQAVIISTARTFAYAAKNNGRTALRTEGMAGVKA